MLLKSLDAILRQNTHIHTEGLVDSRLGVLGLESVESCWMRHVELSMQTYWKKYCTQYSFTYSIAYRYNNLFWPKSSIVCFNKAEHAVQSYAIGLNYKNRFLDLPRATPSSKKLLYLDAVYLYATLRHCDDIFNIIVNWLFRILETLLWKIW